MNWKGVTPAITTPFNENLSVDHGFLAEHARWLVETGCAGVVALGSLARARRCRSTRRRAFFRRWEKRSMAAVRSSPRSRLSRLLSQC